MKICKNIIQITKLICVCVKVIHSSYLLSETLLCLYLKTGREYNIYNFYRLDIVYCIIIPSLLRKIYHLVEFIGSEVYTSYVIYIPLLYLFYIALMFWDSVFRIIAVKRKYKISLLFKEYTHFRYKTYIFIFKFWFV